MSGQPKRPWRLLWNDGRRWRVYGTYATRERAEVAEERDPMFAYGYRIEAVSVEDRENG